MDKYGFVEGFICPQCHKKMVIRQPSTAPGWDLYLCTAMRTKYTKCHWRDVIREVGSGNQYSRDASAP